LCKRNGDKNRLTGGLREIEIELTDRKKATEINRAPYEGPAKLPQAPKIAVAEI